MKTTEEENFPRGGHKPKIRTTLKRPKDDNVRKSVAMRFFIYDECFIIVISSGIDSKKKKGEKR